MGFTIVGIMVLENFAAIAPAVVVLFLVFSGYMLNEASMPDWIGWIKYLSFIRYAFQAMCVNEFKGADHFNCTPEDRACLQGDDWLVGLKFDQVSIGLNMLWLGLELLAFN